jgi:signal transduction histidine kinase/DNA-binding response OmpR family regulator
MSECVINYLNTSINHVENISELNRIYMCNTNSLIGGIFVNINNKYRCLDYINVNKSDDTLISFEPESDILNVKIIESNINNIIITKYNDIIKLLIIPIIIQSDILGLIVLANFDIFCLDNYINILSPIIGLSQIILGKKKLEIEKNENENYSKDLFLANMSHEIRTPLNGIIGYNQLLLQSDMSSVQKGYLHSMNQCSLQLMQIINDILDFSKLTSGKMSLNKECFSIKEIIDSIESAMNQRFIEKRQKFIPIINIDIPEFIIVDKSKLLQIIINLISNANKFTDIGGTIKLIFSALDKNTLCVSVIDNGIGISEINQLKLFNTFEQINHSLFKTGTGLGLAISKKLVELLGGNITVQSQLGQGSTFTFNIKFEPYENFTKNLQQDAELLKNKEVLVVDDNANNRILLSEILFEWNMKPTVCASALEALRMILGQRYNFSIGLIDICMPGISGTELARQIKEEKPFFPLIALSSVDSFVSSNFFEQKLDKPINKVQLFNAIYKILSKNKTPSAYIGDTQEIESQKLETIPNKNIKILIAEDVIFNRVLLKNMLENLGYNNIITAENGQEAFTKIKEAINNNNPFKILLLDLRMPIMDGYKVIELMNKHSYQLPIIIAVTASVMEMDKKKCSQMNVKYFITKPIDLQQLKEVLIHVTQSFN